MRGALSQCGGRGCFKFCYVYTASFTVYWEAEYRAPLQTMNLLQSKTKRRYSGGCEAQSSSDQRIYHADIILQQVYEAGLVYKLNFYWQC